MRSTISSERGMRSRLAGYTNNAWATGSWHCGTDQRSSLSSFDVFGGSRTLLLRGQLAAYCARGADQNHEWIRVPPTPANEITTGIMEERPPEPVVRLPR